MSCCLHFISIYWLLPLVLTIANIALSSIIRIIWILVTAIKACYTKHKKSYYIKYMMKSPHLNFSRYYSWFFWGSSLTFIFLLVFTAGVVYLILNCCTYVKNSYNNIYKNNVKSSRAEWFDIRHRYRVSQLLLHQGPLIFYNVDKHLSCLLRVFVLNNKPCINF